MPESKQRHEEPPDSLEEAEEIARMMRADGWPQGENRSFGLPPGQQPTGDGTDDDDPMWDDGEPPADPQPPA